MDASHGTEDIGQGMLHIELNYWTRDASYRTSM
jgi:hypothetical protein